MATSKELEMKLELHEAAWNRTKQFIAAGGDTRSEEGKRLGLELIKTANELWAAFENPFLKRSNA